jgi:hypothetical protein
MAEDQPEQQPQPKAALPGDPCVYLTFARDSRHDIVFSDRGTVTVVFGGIADVEEMILILRDLTYRAKNKPKEKAKRGR